MLAGQDTKSGRPDERPVPLMLNDPIALYLTCARPRLRGTGEFMIGQDTAEGEAGGGTGCLLSGPLWVGEKGEELLQSGIDQALKATTRKTLGVGLSPHDFLRCAASTAAYRASTMPHLASALLQYKDRRVTEEHYT